MLLAWITFFSILGSVGAIGGAALLLVFPQRIRSVLIPCLLSYATGTLLGAAFLGMIPTGLADAPALQFSATILLGIVLFFVMEKLVLWRHSHEENDKTYSVAPALILVGDAFHNLIDGFAIASAFLAAVPLGIATSLAVIAHEVPQELGDFAILLDGGYSRARALGYNSLSALATLPGAVIGFFFLDTARQIIPYVLALSAASFIYIAIADLVPNLNRRLGLKPTVLQLLLMLLGIGTIALFR
jgi:zinc and cadmium transporter